MRLRSCLKRYKDDTHRTLAPEETLSRIDAKMPAAGITRVADITNLDRVGIPVFSSIRPMAEKGAISVYNGKGATPTEAKVSAMMEGIERYSGELKDMELIISRFSELKKERVALNPSTPGDTLRAEAREVSRSRRISCYHIEVKNEKGDLIATCQAMAYRKKDPLPFM